MKATKKLLRKVALTLALILLFSILPSARAAAVANYVLHGERQGGKLVLTVSARGVTAVSGRVALCYDTSKLALDGDALSAVHKSRGVQYIFDDGAPVEELVDPARGLAGFAWVCANPLNGATADAPIATMTFTVLGDDFDAGTLRLRHIPDDFGAWTAAASLAVKVDAPVPAHCAYLRDDTNPLGIIWDYEGADREPSNGHTVTLQCRDLTGAVVPGSLELNGRTYETDAQGNISLKLLDGSYDYYLTAEGYGPRRGVLDVSGDTTVPVVFYTDEMLVAKAKDELEIGYAEGESAEKVQSTLDLPRRTDDGVEITWKSSNTAVITDSGLIFRPELDDAKVTMTATLVCGAARAEKSFDLTVLAKPRPGSPSRPSSASRFSDVNETSFAWAQEAVEALARAGIIQGTGGGKFSPADPIRRADFLLMLTRMIPIDADLSGVREFSDVPAGSYYHDAVLTARALGVTNGAGGNRFLPASYITRQEMAVLTVRILEATGYISFQAAERVDLGARFQDGATAAAWARDSLSKLVGRGFLQGVAGTLTPTANTNRAQAAVFLYRIYQAAGR